MRRAVRRDMPVAASASFTYHNRTKRLAFGAPRICNSYRNAQIPAHLRVSAVARSRFGEPVSVRAERHQHRTAHKFSRLVRAGQNTIDGWFPRAI